MEEEHQELHRELAKATEIRGKVGEAARKVAQVLHPHFVKENEVALPVVGVARELAEGKTLLDFGEVLELHDKFKNEYEKMLQEHSEIVNALDVLEKMIGKLIRQSQGAQPSRIQ
jgi:hemerythrin-like domain-containing protein